MQTTEIVLSTIKTLHKGYMKVNHEIYLNIARLTDFEIFIVNSKYAAFSYVGF